MLKLTMYLSDYEDDFIWVFAKCVESLHGNGSEGETAIEVYTCIILTSGKSFSVEESPEEIMTMMMEVFNA